MMYKWSAFGNATNLPYWETAEGAAPAFCAQNGQPYVGLEVRDETSVIIKCYLEGYGNVERYMSKAGFCPYGVAAIFWTWDGFHCSIYEDNNDSCTVGNPVNIFDGSKQDRVVDYRGSGAFPIIFERRYNSTITGKHGDWGVDRGFGSWGHNYAQEVRTMHQYDDGRDLVRIYHSDGTYSTHTQIAGTQTYEDYAKGALKGDLEKTATGWVLNYNGGARDTFNSQGKLTAKANASSLVHTISYNVAGGIDKIASSDGDEITFQYGADGKISNLSAASGQVVGYVHAKNVAGELIRVDYSDGEVLEYGYADDGSTASQARLLTSISRNGAVQAEYEYDDDNRVSKEWKAGGSGLRTFDYRQYETDVTNPLGRKATYRHANLGNSVKILGVSGAATENCVASATTYEYDADGQLSAKLDWEGNRTEYIRDNLGRITSMTVAKNTPEERTTTTTWHTQWSKPVQRVEPGRTTYYTYDSNGNVATKTVTDTATGESRVWVTNYSATGQLLSMDGPRTDVTDTTTFTYYNCTTGGKCGQRHTATNALGQVTTFNDYDAHGNPLSITDANGVLTTLSYDLRQRLLTSTVDGSTTTYTYDGVGNITRVTSPDGAYLAYEWDQANRLVAIEDALGNRMEWDLDAADNRTATRYKDPSGTVKLNQQQQFDELSRLIKTVYAVSGEASYGYDKNGNRTSSVEPGGATTASAYDALNRLISSTDANNGVTGYGYDALDHMTTVTDPAGAVTTYTYNAFGDVLTLQSPDTGTTTYTVDAAGNRTSETDARGVTVNYQYDALNRLIAKTFPDASLNISYSYDQGANGIGRLSSVTDSTGSIAYSYDGRGNTTEQRSTIDGVLYTTSYTYDAANKLERTTYASGRTLDYGYDTAGRLSTITHTGDGGSETLISSAQYLPFGPMTGYTLGNGTVRTVEYDLDYRIGRIADGSIMDRSYAYRAANNISSITDALTPANTQLFGYDDLNRLTSASGDYGSHGYSYDAVGNRQSFTDDQGSQSYSYTANSNRLTAVGSQTRSRDATGNLTQSSGNAFSYSDQNRLSGVSGLAGTIQYGHNALGQRVSKTVGGTTRHYLFDTQGQLIGEANSDGTAPVEYAYLNGQPLAMWRSVNTEPTVPEVVTLIAPLDAVDTDSPTFEWQASEHATRYRVQVYDRATRQNVHLATHEATAVCSENSCALTPEVSLGYSRNHFWRVRAWNIAGWSDWSTLARFDRLPPVTSAPSLLSPLVTVDSASPTFEWQASEHATRYRVQVYDRATRQNVHLATHEATAVCSENSCALTPEVSLGYSRNHFWRVRAWNIAGWSDWSTLARFDRLPPVTSAPSLLSPLVTVDSASPTFEWQASEHATRYRVQVYDRATRQNVHLATHEATAVCSENSCALTPEVSLGYSRNHFWRVRAWNIAGWSDWSTLARFDRLPPVTSAPSLLSPLVTVDSASPTFEWQASEHATRYRVQVYDRATRQNVHLATHEATAVCSENSCALTPEVSLGYSRNHFWRVRAWNIAGWSDWSTLARFDRLPPVTSAPSLLSPLATVDSASPTFEWQASEHATRYRVQVYDRATRQNVHLATHEATAVCSENSCALTPEVSLGYSRNHFWRVRAWNIAGWSDWAAITRFDYEETTALGALAGRGQ